MQSLDFEKSVWFGWIQFYFKTLKKKKRFKKHKCPSGAKFKRVTYIHIYDEFYGYGTCLFYWNVKKTQARIFVCTIHVYILIVCFFCYVGIRFYLTGWGGMLAPLVLRVWRGLRQEFLLYVVHGPCHVHQAILNEKHHWQVNLQSLSCT